MVITKLSDRVFQFFMLWFRIAYDDFLVALNMMENGTAYQTEKHSKGKGKGLRTICKPCWELKTIQRNILNNFLLAIPIHFAAYCRDGSSFVGNARLHSGAMSLYNLDLRQAFPSVPRHRVQAHLKGPLHYHLEQFGLPFTEAEESELLEAILDVVIFNDALPQGAPSSPALLNIVCMYLDQQITRYLASQTDSKYQYTRYVDDITITSNQPEIPEPVRKEIKRIIDDCGFHINLQKEDYKPNLQKTSQKAVVTGLLMHPGGKLTVEPKKLAAYRARLDRLAKTKGKLNEHQRGEIRGIAGFLEQVYPDGLPSKVREVVSRARARVKVA